MGWLKCMKDTGLNNIKETTIKITLNIVKNEFIQKMFYCTLILHQIHTTQDYK